MATYSIAIACASGPCKGQYSMNAIEAKQLLRETLDSHGLTHVDAVLNNKLTRVFGRYCWSELYPTKRVELSTKLVTMNNRDRVLRTIYHEVAHALTEGHKHDAVWKSKCIEIGGDGIPRYSRIDTNAPSARRSTKLYRLECDDCGYTGGRYRRRMNGYTHKYCGGNMLSVEIQ